MKVVHKLAMAVASCCLALVASAQAGTIDYTFTYTDIYGVTAHGTLQSSSTPADIPGNPGGAGYLVTAGSITVTTANPLYSVADGTYPLALAGPAPTFVVGDTIDNLVYPGNNAGSGTYGGVPSPAYIDTNGLEFGYTPGDPSNPNAEVFIGIFALGGSNYALGWSPDGTHPHFDSPSVNRNGDYGQTLFPGGGSFVLLVVPEPSSLAMLSLAGILAAAWGLRHRRA